MAATDFANKIIQKMKGGIGTDGGGYGASTPTSANAAIAEAVTEYILEHAVITASYTGTMPNGSADPLVIDTFKVVGSCAPVRVCSHFDDWLTILRDHIADGFRLAPSGNAGLVFPAKPFNPVAPIVLSRDGDLKGIASAGGSGVQQNVWTRICQAVLAWLNGAPNPSATGPATHSSSTGNAVVTVNSVP